jgi:hypothetical protein
LVRDLNYNRAGISRKKLDFNRKKSGHWGVRLDFYSLKVDIEE